MKIYRKIPVLLLLIVSNFSYGQNSPSLTLSIGLSLPAQDLGGELTNTGDSGISFISRDFIKNNYANSAGVSLSGTLLIPFGKKSLIIGRLSGSYTFFNVFRKTFFGVTKENNIDVNERPIPNPSQEIVATAQVIQDRDKSFSRIQDKTFCLYRFYSESIQHVTYQE